MRKTFQQFEQVPVAVVEKILEQQTHFTKFDKQPNVKRKAVARKLKRAARGLRLLPKKAGVLTS